jgi:FixJ family two-component response regulator
MPYRPQAQEASGILVERLDTFDKVQEEWRQALLEDRRATPAEIAIARIDLADWLRSLSRRNRQIAKTLAMGETTSNVARQFQLSAARVSQIRRELEASWERFQSGDQQRED